MASELTLLKQHALRVGSMFRIIIFYSVFTSVSAFSSDDKWYVSSNDLMLMPRSYSNKMKPCECGETDGDFVLEMSAYAESHCSVRREKTGDKIVYVDIRCSSSGSRTQYFRNKADCQKKLGKPPIEHDPSAYK